MSGFRQHSSSMDSVLDFITSVEEAKERKKTVIAVIAAFLDVKRAYDTVSHASVLHPLTQVGLPFRALAWIKDFLHGRQRFVRTHQGDACVTVDARLSWVKHIASLEAKVHWRIAVIRHLAGMKWGSAVASLLTVHRALIRGSLAYSLPVLNGLPPSSVHELPCLRARSLRVCLGVHRAAQTDMVIAEAKEALLEVLRYGDSSAVPPPSSSPSAASGS
ncbi:uncharacterized protein LOC135389214 [Ornithodoros turicata]|uniref:uncharacterized protein LOC135389214 n=1 Tax=Ornithodoros turicata TaxID=34597 RepID=UPI00313A20D7